MILSRIGWRILFFLSAPIILPEAIYARWRTPRLPEAKEPTEGKSASVIYPPFRIAFIGESTIAGVGAHSMKNALTGQTIRALERKYCVKWNIIGHNGIRIAELQPFLTAELLTHLQVIVVAIGANDTTKITSFNAWIDGLTRFIATIRGHSGAPIIFSQLPPMHLFTALPQPLRTVVGQRAILFDRGLKRVCKTNEGCHYLPLNFEPKPGYLATDGYHPSELAYQEWGERLAINIYEIITIKLMEPEDLKYPIGKFKALTVVDQVHLDQAITHIIDLPEKLSEAISPRSENQLDTPYRPGGWTIRQLAHHIVDSHINAYARMKIALTENEPTIRPYQEAEWAKLDDSSNTSVNDSLEMLALLHRRWGILMLSLDEKQWSRKYYHPGDQEWVSLRSMVCIYAWHGQHHLAHVTSLVKREHWQTD
jgi:lysophospholipase L1-like esterase